MKKSLLITIGIVLAVIALWLVFIALRPHSDNVPTENTAKPNYKDATYTIDGRTVSLKNGLDINQSEGIVTRYFGNEAKGDLNADGRDDVAFLLTQDRGGSGLFYYLAVALAADQGYEGLDAVFLGDRIAPQPTEIKAGEIIVNFADRKAGEPFTIAPSAGVSRFFRILDRRLIEQSR